MTNNMTYIYNQKMRERKEKEFEQGIKFILGHSPKGTQTYVGYCIRCDDYTLAVKKPNGVWKCSRCNALRRY